jgi:hypothetical protein
MKEGILPGALVRRITHSPRGPARNELCTVLGTSLFGGAIWVMGYSKPYASNNFELLYNDLEDFDHDWVTEGTC